MRVLTLAVLLAVPATAGAQDVAGMYMRAERQQASPTGAGLPTDAQSLRKISAYGRCLASAELTNVFESLPDSREDRKIVSSVGVMPSPCNNYGRISGNTLSFMRGVAAEYFLHRDFDLSSGTQLRKPRKVFAAPTQAKVATLPPEEKSSLAFVEYGTCVATVDMPNLSRLFATEVASGQESEAFKLLVPTMSQCLSPGLTLKMNTLKLRGYLAEGAYRRLSVGPVK